ncbi:MAG TPA: hypothetical protein VMD02_03395 [Candidatus Omnitrophota bacterium]|nr:hypothetical protein [Candidatus Omnitrophota bacterium]
MGKLSGRSVKNALNAAAIGSLFGLMLIFNGCGVMPPTITTLTASPATVTIGGTSVITCVASSKSTLSYSWRTTGGTLSSSSGNSVSWTAPDTIGSYSITVTVSDGTNSVSGTVSIVVTSASWPAISSLTVSPATVVTTNVAIITCEATGKPSTGTGESSAPLTFTWTCSGGVLSATSGKNILWTAPSTTGTYTVTVTVSDGTYSNTATLTIPVIYADQPVINVLTGIPLTIAVAGSTNNTSSSLYCSASDPNGLDLNYSWSAASGTLTSTKGQSVTFEAPSTAGTYPVQVTVLNTKKSSTTDTLNIIVVTPQNPVITQVYSDVVQVSQGGSANLTCVAYDINGLDLTYSWSATGGGFTSKTNNTATWTTTSTQTTGSYKITVTVSNGTKFTTSSITLEVI